MKINRWSAIIVAFIATCVIASWINDQFTAFGYENCEKVTDTLDAFEECRSVVREQASSWFNPMFFVIWFVTAVIALASAEKQK